MSEAHVSVTCKVEHLEQQQADLGIRLVVPGDQYYATLISTEERAFFKKKHRVEFWWRVVSANLEIIAELPGYCTIDPHRRRPASKFATWQQLIAIYTGGSPNKVTLRSFKQFVFRVEVQTVIKNGDNKERTSREQYSQVRDLLEVVGRRSDRA